MDNVGEPTRVEIYPDKEAIVRFDPERTFTCVDSCTWCCHHGVLLYGPDLDQLAEKESLAESTESIRGHPFVRKESKARMTAVDDAGEACYYLDDDGLCHLQKEHNWKPTRCSVFPLDITLRGDALEVSIRETAETHCEGMDVGDRRLIDHLDAFLPPQLWDLPDPTTHIEL